MNLEANRNQLWARVLVDELARAGVTEVVISPGSRSTPLVLAFAADPRVRITVQIDERCAGFQALGIGRGSGHPAAVVTTSGTAAANLFPAVVEASQGDVPLLVLTADRPHALRDADANQAIDQIRLFGPYVRAFHEVAPPTVDGPALRHLRALAGRAVASALGVPGGPVHLNFPFAKPLEPIPVPGDIPVDFPEAHPLAHGGRTPAGTPFVRIAPRRPTASRADLERVDAALGRSRRPILVGGAVGEPDRIGPSLQALALGRGIPLLADPLSGARHGAPGGTPVVGSYDLFLRSGAVRRGFDPDLIVRFGSSPTSAALTSLLLESNGVEQIVVDGGGRWKDHLAVATDYIHADPGDLVGRLVERGSGEGRPDAWTARWMGVERITGQVIETELSGEAFEGGILAGTAAALPADGLLFVSSSMPIRDLDAFVPPRPHGLRIRANRGASGIDGVISTALGVRMGTLGPMAAVLGDLAFYHDLNGLLALRDVAPDLVLVVIQNDGGGIFNMLPIREFEPAFTPYFSTPHGLDFARAAHLYDLPHVRVEAGPGEVEAAVRAALASGGPRIVEVRTEREANRRRHDEVVAAVAGRVGAQL